jgi:hypothetical protein
MFRFTPPLNSPWSCSVSHHLLIIPDHVQVHTISDYSASHIKHQYNRIKLQITTGYIIIHKTSDFWAATLLQDRHHNFRITGHHITSWWAFSDESASRPPVWVLDDWWPTIRELTSLDEFCSLTVIQCQVKLKYERLMTLKKEKGKRWWFSSRLVFSCLFES